MERPEEGVNMYTCVFAFSVNAQVRIYMSVSGREWLMIRDFGSLLSELRDQRGRVGEGVSSTADASRPSEPPWRPPSTLLPPPPSLEPRPLAELLSNQTDPRVSLPKSPFPSEKTDQ